MDDYELDDRACTKCGHSPTRWMRCYEPTCENGRVDISDEFFEVEGSSYERCNTCNGKGHLHWCPKCGEDL